MVPIVNSAAVAQQQKLQQMFASELLIQNTAMPSLLQTPLDPANRPQADSLQPLASNNQNQNTEIKPESSMSDLVNQPSQQSVVSNNQPPVVNQPVANNQPQVSNQQVVANVQPMVNNQQMVNNQPMVNQPMINNQPMVNNLNQNALQSSFQQATNIANLLQQSQLQQQQSLPMQLPPQLAMQPNQMNTASLPSFANYAPFLNGNANLNEMANLLSNLQKGQLPNNQMPNNQLLAPTRLDTSVFTTESMITKTSTKIYTLIYNGFSTKYRTVTSTSVYPTTITQTTTKVVSMMNTISPLDFNSLFG